MVLDWAELTGRFDVYTTEMRRCAENECWWALLHLLVAYPGVCAALEQDDGKTTGRDRVLYVDWCGRHFQPPDPRLTPEDRYLMRCKVLHEGKSALDGGSDFMFAPPGVRPHLAREGRKLVVDVKALYEETASGREHWIQAILAAPTSKAAQNVARWSESLVKDYAVFGPAGPGSDSPFAPGPIRWTTTG